MRGFILGPIRTSHPRADKKTPGCPQDVSQDKRENGTRPRTHPGMVFQDAQDASRMPRMQGGFL